MTVIDSERCPRPRTGLTSIVGNSLGCRNAVPNSDGPEGSLNPKPASVMSTQHVLKKLDNDAYEGQQFMNSSCRRRQWIEELAKSDSA